MFNRVSGRSAQSRKRAALAGCWLLIGLSMAAWGQEPSQPPTEPAAPRAAETPLDRIPSTVRYLMNDQGQPVAVPADATIEDYLRWLKDGRPKERETPQEIAFLSLEMDGVAQDEWAVVRARVAVMVSSDQPIRTVLGFREAILRDEPQYVGPGTLVPVLDDNKVGLAFWLTGRGRHELELPLLVPIRRLSGVQRLVLSLPMTPASRLKFRVPLENAAPKSAEPAVFEVRSTGGNETEFDVWGLGNQLDFQWQAARRAVDTDTGLEASTQLRAEFAQDAVVVNATQTVSSQAGTFDRFSIVAPQLSNYDGPELREVLPDPQHKSRWTILLRERTAGPVTITWQARLPYTEKQRVTFENYEVVGARRHTGEIGLYAQEGLHFTSEINRDAASQNVIQMAAGELKVATGKSRAQRAYRILGQPFRLQAAVEPLEPYLTVEPVSTLVVQSDSMQLESRLKCRVLRGRVSDLTLQFPNFGLDGWMLESIEPRSIVELAAIPESASGDRLRLSVSDPNVREIDLKLKARRQTRATNGNIPLSLPTLVADGGGRHELQLQWADNVRCQFVPITADGNSHRWLSATTNKESTGAGWVWQGSGPPRFELAVETFAPRLLAETDVSLDWQADRWLVRQKIPVLADFQRQNRIRLKVPAAIVGRLQVMDERNQELSFAPEEAAADGSQLLAVRLPEPRLGPFVIHTRYDLLHSDARYASENRLKIPVATLVEAPARVTRLRAQASDWLSVTPQGGAWEAQVSELGDDLWQANGEWPEINLAVDYRHRDRISYETVLRSRLTVLVDGASSMICSAQFRLPSQPRLINWLLPPQSRVTRVWWGRNLLAGSRWNELPEGSGRFTAFLGEMAEASSEPLLTIEYRPPTSMDWLLAAPTPALAGYGVGTQTLVDVTLPNGRHLFWYPTTATPMFRWERSGMTYRRKSLVKSNAIEAWIGGAAGPTIGWEGQGNTYLFSQLSTIEPLRFCQISGPMIVLIGSGIALAAGFLWLRFAVLRHALTLLVAAFAIALSGLWFHSSLEVLLQPFLAGLLLPLGAVLFELWQRRAQSSPVLTLATPSDFIPPGPTPGDLARFDVGAIDETAFRPPHDGLRLPPIHVESESGAI